MTMNLMNTADEDALKWFLSPQSNEKAYEVLSPKNGSNQVKPVSLVDVFPLTRQDKYNSRSFVFVPKTWTDKQAEERGGFKIYSQNQLCVVC